MIQPNRTNDTAGYRPLSVQLTDPRPGDRMADDDYDKLADPRRDHIGQRKTGGKTDRLLRLLDSLETETTDRRRNH